MAAPQNLVALQGQTAISADNFNTVIQWTTNIASLRAFSGAVPIQVAYIVGYSTPNDGGQGHYYWNATSTAPDNGTSVIVPSGVGTGAWIRLG